jgi:hypothetical protein
MNTPPRRVASLLVERYDLEPPIDVEGLISAFGCELEFCDWPFVCDAVADLSADPPRLFVNASSSALRQRFTLAHELGHVAMGWHLNTVMCDIGFDTSQDPIVLRTDQEGQANEFASYLLVPHRFRTSITSGAFDLPAILDQLETAEVSAAAGLIALQSYLPPGVVLRTTSLAWPVVSRGTGQGIKDLVSNELWPEVERRAAAYGTHGHQGQRVRWYSFWNPRVPSVIDDPRRSVDILRDAIAQTGLGGDELEQLRMSVSGIVGAAVTDSTIIDSATIYGILEQRITADDELSDLIQVADFHLFIARKALEIAHKRGGS